MGNIINIGKYDMSGLLAARYRRELSQKELCKLTGLSDYKIARAEKGKMSLSEKDLRTLSVALDFPVKFFEQVFPYHGELRQTSPGKCHWYIDPKKATSTIFID